ncbi:MAG: 3-dehydroquinate synthase, partial [Clostridiales bacterium]
TLGHAIEKCSSYTVSHGQGVAIGMVMIARAGEKLALTKSGLANEIAHVLASNGLPIATEFSVGDLLAAALADKKRSGEEITLVFPRSIGDCLLKTLPVADLEEIITLAKEE